MTIDLVIKVGGRLLEFGEQFQLVLDAIGSAALMRPLLVVPGGGPFADLVRDIDRKLGLSDDAAHWMAIGAMDQYAHLVASRLSGGVVVVGTRDMAVALDAQRVPVLAPSRWLREADPLPHSWDVTSDSIAAWVAGQVEARGLVLVKPPGASGSGVVDPYFSRALPPHVETFVIRADDSEALSSALRDGPST
jgi:aspartokinase-like uncharacterized kinase